MKNKILFSGFFVLFFSFPLFPISAQTTPPPTKCVTNETQNMRAATEALFTKDTAPYTQNPDAQAAIKTYRDKLDIAWSALEQPYCGYAQKNLNSVKRSYNKAAIRARTNFQTQVKALQKSGVNSENVKTPTAKIPATETPAGKTIIPLGLTLGQRSNDVLNMQKKLAAYFKMTDPSTITTGYFGPQTQKWLIKFQIEKKIISNESDPGAGLVGPKTAKALNEI